MNFGNEIPMMKRLQKLYADKSIDITKRNWTKQVIDSMENDHIIDFSVYDEEGRKKRKDTLRKQFDKHVKEETKTGISEEYIRLYCIYFGCSADYLLGYIDTPLHSAYDDVPLNLDAIESLRLLAWCDISDNRKGRLITRMSVINCMLSDRTFLYRFTDTFAKYALSDMQGAFNYPVIKRNNKWNRVDTNKTKLALSALPDKPDENIEVPLDHLTAKALVKNEIDILLEKLKSDYLQYNLDKASDISLLYDVLFAHYSKESK